MTDIRSITSAVGKTRTVVWMLLVQYALILLAAYIGSLLFLGIVLLTMILTVVREMSSDIDPYGAAGALGILGLALIFVISLVVGCAVFYVVGAVDNVAVDVAALSIFAFAAWYSTRDEKSGFLHHSGLKYTSGYLRKHRDTLVEKVRDDASVFGNAVSGKIRSDRGIAMAAIGSAIDNYKLASIEIRSDPTFVIEVFDNKDFYAQKKHKILELLTSNLLADPRIQKRLEAPAFWNGSSGLQKIQKKFIPAEKFNDRSFVLSLVRSNPYIFPELDKSFRSDREILESALTGRGMFEYAPEYLRSDRELVLKAVSISGFNLSAASEELRGDREIVLEAVRVSGESLGFASEELRNDKKFVLEAVRTNGVSFTEVSEEMRGDREIVLEAIRAFHGDDHDFDSFLEDHVAEEKFLDDEIYEAAEEVFVSIVWDSFFSHEDWADDEDNEEGLEKRPTTFDEVLSQIDSSRDLDGERFCEVPRKLEQAYRKRMGADS